MTIYIDADACHQYGTLVIPQIHYGGLGTHPQCGKLTSPTAVKWRTWDGEARCDDEQDRGCLHAFPLPEKADPEADR